MSKRRKDDRRGADESFDGLVPDILRSWRDIATAHEPWRHMAADDQCGELRLVVVALVNAVVAPRRSRTALARIRLAASVHGRYRFRQGCAEQVAHVDIEFLNPPAVALIGQFFERAGQAATAANTLEDCARVALEGVACGYEEVRRKAHA